MFGFGTVAVVLVEVVGDVVVVVLVGGVVVWEVDVVVCGVVVGVVVLFPSERAAYAPPIIRIMTITATAILADLLIACLILERLECIKCHDGVRLDKRCLAVQKLARKEKIREQLNNAKEL